MSGGGEKTEKPTPKKIRDARKEGQVARSQDIGAWATVLAGTIMIQFTLRSAAPRMQDLFSEIAALTQAPSEAGALAILVQGGVTIAVLAAPFGLVLALVALLASAAQGGVYLATKNLKPKFSRMSPIEGFKRIAGPNAAWEAIKAVAKTSVAGYLVYRSVAELAPTFASLGSMPLLAALATAGSTAMTLMRDVALAGLVMGLADYAYQRRRTGKQLRMTKHEVKQEHKQAEGDPLLKGAIRSRQIAMSRNRMMSAVADADVVLVNPTHVAVALRYQPERGAPRVVAKGAGAVAARIREEADKHRIPMVHDVPLARALHAACDLDQEVPAELFTAVAEVLAFVLALKARGSAAGTHRVGSLATASR